MHTFITRYRQATSRMESSSARGIFFAGIFDFIAQKANVVVAPIIVGGNQHALRPAQ